MLAAARIARTEPTDPILLPSALMSLVHMPGARLTLGSLACFATVAGAQAAPTTRDAMRVYKPPVVAAPQTPVAGHRLPAGLVMAPVTPGIAPRASRTSSPFASVRRASPLAGASPARQGDATMSKSCENYFQSLPRTWQNLEFGRDGTTGGVGTYQIDGCDEHGIGYRGTATITHIRGQMYRVVAKIGEVIEDGVAFGDDDQLTVALATGRDTAGVVSYLVKGDGLDGVWFSEGDSRLGNEYLRPRNGRMTKSLGEHYNISGDKLPYSAGYGAAHFPNGTAYDGTALVTPLDLGPANDRASCFALRWDINGGSTDGIGVRTGEGQDAVLSAGFSSGNSTLTVQVLSVGDANRLNGWWLESSNGQFKRGRDRWTLIGP